MVLEKFSQLSCNNSNLSKMEEDVLYHLGLTTKSINFKEAFGDVKFVCVAGSGERMKKFAVQLAEEAGLDTALTNLSASGGRFVMYKVGSVLCANHGMGTPSVSILLNELFKLFYYAECTEVTFLRLGTSGGIGVPSGTIVITTEAVNTEFRPVYELHVLGKVKEYSSENDLELAAELLDLADKSPESFKAVKGKSVCCNDFYEEQARLDGAFCDYTEEKKLDYLQRAHANGVRNFEMEGTCFAALCRRAGFRSGMLCVALLNRIKSDQIVLSQDEYERIQLLPCQLAAAFLKKHDAFKTN